MHRDKAFSGGPNEAFKEAMWFLVEQKHPGNTFQTWVGHWAALNLAPCLRHRPPGSLRTSLPSSTELPPLLTNEVPSQGRGCTASWGIPVIWQSAEITCANFLSLFHMAVSTPRWDNVEISDGKRNGVPGSPCTHPSHSHYFLPATQDGLTLSYPLILLLSGLSLLPPSESNGNRLLLGSE